MELILSLSNFLYLFTAILAFLSIVIKSKKTEIVTKIFFIISFALSIVYFIYRWYLAGHIPVTDAFSSFVFFTICLGLFQVIAIKKSKIFVILLSSLLISFTLFALSIAGFDENIEPLIPALKSNWLAVHVITSFLAYAAFAINFTIALYALYSSKHKSDLIIGSALFGILVSGLFSGFVYYFFKLGLATLFVFSLISFVLVMFGLIYFHKPKKDISIKYMMSRPIYLGFPLLTTGIVTGSIWAKYAWGGYWSWDPKEVWSLITWIIYLIYIHFNLKNKSQRFMAYLAIIGFISVLITYLGVNFIMPGLHSYASQ